MKEKIWDVAVIGGGPAGMMSAGRASELGASVILIEKNSNLGKKLLLTGGGRCNVTNAEFDNRKLLEKFKDNGKFLFSAFSQFSVKESLEFFNSRNMLTKIEAENRVFPQSDSSESVLNVLLDYIREGKVAIKSNCPVTSIDIDSESEVTEPMQRDNDTSSRKIESVTLGNGEKIRAKSFIIATGGKAYPETGSTGDGFTWLSKLGHTIIEPNSSLVPIAIKDAWVKDLQGITMPEVKISLFQEGKKLISKKGKILFTHFGVSGPTILNMSKTINELLPNGDVFIGLDLLPNLDFSTLNEELQRIFRENINKKIKNTLDDLIPSRIVPIILLKSLINPETFVNSITREERIRLMNVLKNIQMKVERLLGLENSIVSSGGVDLKEVDFKTMSSRLFPNLFLVGDILNIDRPSGGYSLQICWTTGFVAGTNASKFS